MHGAPLLYNLILAEQAHQKDGVAKYRRTFGEWAKSLAERSRVLAQWDRKRFWELVRSVNPRFLVQSARPVLILDEPQNMESEGRIRALASLDPLFALRYSATHRNPYNLVYRLTPFEAYRQSLVEKIQVASVVKEDDFNQVFVRVEEIRTAGKTVQAKIALHKRMAGAAIKEKAFLFKPGGCSPTGRESRVRQDAEPVR